MEQRLAYPRSVWHVEGPLIHQGLVAAAEGVDLGRQYEPTLAVVEIRVCWKLGVAQSGCPQMLGSDLYLFVFSQHLPTKNTVGFMWVSCGVHVALASPVLEPLQVPSFYSCCFNCNTLQPSPDPRRVPASSSVALRSQLSVHTALPRYRHVVLVVATPPCHRPGNIAGIAGRVASWKLETSRLNWYRTGTELVQIKTVMLLRSRKNPVRRRIVRSNRLCNCRDF